MTIPIHELQPRVPLLVPPLAQDAVENLTSESWFECADRERGAGEQLAALAAYGRAADAALAEKKPMAVLDAKIEQAQIWAERGQVEELKKLGEQLHRFAYSKQERPLTGGLLRGVVFAHFVTLAALGQPGPLFEVVLNVREVRLSGALLKFPDRLESAQEAEDRFNERLSYLWSLKE